MANLKRDFSIFKEEYYKRDRELGTEVDKKVDKADLVEFERLMRDRMEATEKAIQKIKGEMKKALKILDDKVKRIGDQAKERGPSMEREDAMLAKKPLEGWKCANWDKGLVNMSGLPAEHYIWNKMPKKEGERVPMMGQGFSRMLMTLNHNQSSPNIQSKTFYSAKVEDVEEEAYHSSRDEKLRNSVSRVEKDGSTTMEASVLPQIKKGSRTRKK